MAWAIITIYTYKCAQMDPQQLPETSKFYSRSKKCDIKKTLGGWVPPPLVARRLNCEYFRSLQIKANRLIVKSMYYNVYTIATGGTKEKSRKESMEVSILTCKGSIHMYLHDFLSDVNYDNSRSGKLVGKHSQTVFYISETNFYYLSIVFRCVSRCSIYMFRSDTGESREPV